MSSRNILLIVAFSIIVLVALYSSTTTRDSTTTANQPQTTTKEEESSITKSPAVSITQNVVERQEDEVKTTAIQKEEISPRPQLHQTNGKIFSKQFLNSDDAAGQIWEFPATSEYQIREFPKTFSQIKQEYDSCKGKVNYSGIPDFQEIFKASETTPFWKTSDDEVEMICKKRGSKRITDPEKIPFLVYGALFGFEVNILEIVLHEAVPIVDALVISESTITHAKHSKPVVFRGLIKSNRFKRFADLVQPESETESEEKEKEQNTQNNNSKTKYKIFPRIFSSRKEKSGWDVERKQRREFQRSLPSIFKYLVNTYSSSSENDKQAKSIVPERPVIVISQLDLDEIPSRESLLYWKYCEEPKLPLRVLWFRYQLECQQELPHSRFYSTIWKVKKITGKFEPGLDLYSRRRAVSPIKNDYNTLTKTLCDTTLFSDSTQNEQYQELIKKDVLDPAVAWHFSAFGGLLAVRRKNKHSPHSFVRREIIREEEIRGCIFNNKERTKLAQGWWMCDSGGEDAKQRTQVMPVALPHFIAENVCLFVKSGWMS